MGDLPLRACVLLRARGWVGGWVGGCVCVCVLLVVIRDLGVGAVDHKPYCKPQV